MIPNPIHKVLSTLSTHQVRYLLMGGQACVFYGAAEFSRDCDIAIPCESENLERLRAALHELDAATIAIPPFEIDFLLRGHAVHFRCQAAEAAQICVDVMAKGTTDGHDNPTLCIDNDGYLYVFSARPQNIPSVLDPSLDQARRHFCLRAPADA